MWPHESIFHTCRKLKQFEERTITFVHNAKAGPVFVIMHCWHTVGLSPEKALLNCPKPESIPSTVTCTPIYFGPGTEYQDVASHPFFTGFVCMSSKDTDSDVDPFFLLRVDIEGNSDARHTY